jgi:excisionase family DNA binding protein
MSATTKPDRRLLTAKQVAEFLGCSMQTVYRIAGTVDLPAFRPKGRGMGARSMVRVWSDDLERYIASGMEGGKK